MGQRSTGERRRQRNFCRNVGGTQLATTRVLHLAALVGKVDRGLVNQRLEDQPDDPEVDVLPHK